jgi:hypothetical protein
MVLSHLFVASVALLPLVFGKEIPANEIIAQEKYASGLVHETIMGLKKVSSVSRISLYVN